VNLPEALARVRRTNPLVLCLTNFVTVNDCANGLLAVGASPVMSLNGEDAAALAEVSGALVLNIGTVTPGFHEAMKLAGNAARKKGVPAILDPVGAGATWVRLSAALELIRSARPMVVRGNASEILALLQKGGDAQKGVDSSFANDQKTLEEAASTLAEKLGTVVAVSGETDILAAPGKITTVTGGSVLLTRLTGMGCLLSALTGAFLAANGEDYFAAARAAHELLKTAGKKAEESLARPGALGEFKIRLFDELSLSGVETA
jgi:hydroxyethylthiazole kinase